jgi:hypothetical protein
MNAIRFPSGKNLAVFSLRSPPISWRAGVDPSAETTQISEFLRPESATVVVLVNATRFPSGDSCGSPTRIVVIKSLMVIARFVCD